MRRRQILRGIAGAAVSAPFLGSAQRRAGASAAEAPRRLVIFHTGAGCLTNRWFPKVEDGPLGARDLEGTTLEPLAPYAGKLLFPRGLAMYPFGVVTVDGNSYFDPHDQAMGSKLTCGPIDPLGAHYALGRSLDHVVAEHVNPGARPPLVLSVGYVSNSVKAVLSYAAPRTPTLPETNPAVVYSNLTGLVIGSEADYRVARGQSIIDVVREDLATFERQDLAANDRLKIDAWLTALREFEQELLPPACSAESIAELGINEQTLAAASDTGDVATAFTRGGDMMLRLIALAMMCDANRSIILQWPGFVTFDFDGISHTHDHQGLSHRNGSAAVGGTCLEGVLTMLAQIDGWYAKRYAELVGLIDGVPEGDETMLDHAAVLWLPELADGNAHNVNNLPIVIAGSASGYLRQGVSVNVAGEPLGAGNSEAYCVNGGEVGFDTGSDTGHVPINKLYVTLLNALGGTAGGEPFTRFGVADSNELEAGITNPGELEALKA